MRSDMTCCNSSHERQSCWFLPFLGAFILLYMCFGAAVFSALEYSREEEGIAEFRNAVAGIVNRSGLSYDDVINIIAGYEEYAERGLSLRDLNDTRRVKWDFFGAFAFTGTVVTTIGFGASSPLTDGARVFFVFYSLLGVSAVYLFFNTWLARSIEYFNCIVGYFKKRLSKTVRRKNNFKPYRGQPHHVLLALSCVAFTLILLVSLFYDHAENWDYLLSFYYCFTAFSTIGFGDIVSGQEEYGDLHVHLYHTLDAVFIAIGCCCVYSMFNIISLFIKKALDSLLLRLHLHKLPPRPKSTRRSFSLERSIDEYEDDVIHEFQSDDDHVVMTIGEENADETIKTISNHLHPEEIPGTQESKLEPSFKRFARQVQFQQRFVNELRRLSSYQLDQKCHANEKLNNNPQPGKSPTKKSLKKSIKRFKRSKKIPRRFGHHPSIRRKYNTERFLSKFPDEKLVYLRPADSTGTCHASLRRVHSAPDFSKSAAGGQPHEYLVEIKVIGNDNRRSRFFLQERRETSAKTEERDDSDWAQESQVFALSIMEDKIPQDL